MRRSAIRNATLEAALVPYQTASEGLRLLELLTELARNGNGNAVSDVGVASLLASAAVKGALFNVDINLKSLPQEMCGTMVEDSNGILEKSRTLSKQSIQAVRERLE